MKILADASLPGLAQAFPKPFELSVYTQASEIPKLLHEQQILFCRSTLKVNEALLAEHSHSLRYVATASSGIDHIDKLYLQNHGIELIDAKGSNASAVADYVIATLAFLQKEKGFRGTRAGIIGLGEVGSQVVKRLNAVGMEIICYDPPKSELEPQFHSSTLDALVHCELICIHANLHDHPPYPSRNLLDKRILSQLKPGSAIINAARGGIVNEEELLTERHLLYCTDVYENEPLIHRKIVDFATLCTPHIAGHSIEAKDAAIEIVSQKLHRAYQLTPPNAISVVSDELRALVGNQSWQDSVLSFYNPLDETRLLKNADNMELAFQTLRKAHKNRHGFSVYNAQLLNEQTRKILGF